MILDNRTMGRDEEIRKLSQFVVQFFKHHKDTKVTVRYGEVGGVAFGHYNPRNNTAVVYLPPHRMYPFIDTYKKRAGSRLMQCWQDEFVRLLAHELRHRDQHGENIKFGEVDAEKYAFKVFDKWRETVESKEP